MATSSPRNLQGLVERIVSNDPVSSNFTVYSTPNAPDALVATVPEGSAFDSIEAFLNNQQQTILMYLEHLQNLSASNSNEYELVFDYTIIRQEGLQSGKRPLMFYGLEVIPTSTLPKNHWTIRRKVSQ